MSIAAPCYYGVIASRDAGAAAHVNGRINPHPRCLSSATSLIAPCAVTGLEGRGGSSGGGAGGFVPSFGAHGALLRPLAARLAQRPARLASQLVATEVLKLKRL